MKYLRQFIRHVISESQSHANLAALVSDNGEAKQATIYDPDALLKHLPSITPHIERGSKEDVIYTLRDEIIRGFIEVGPPEDRGPCYKAWEVKRSAGPGLGQLVYGIGFALSPSGLLIPDRGYVSPSASTGWQKQASKRPSHPLDNISAHNSHNRSARPHPHHTDDISDDCVVHDKEGKEHLDFAYEALGNESQLLSSMTQTHENIMSNNIPHDIQDAIDYLLDYAGVMFFISNFNVPS
jgi:hypothetical protein